MKYLLSLLLFLFPLASQADIYKTIDANGNVIYSDRPSANATVISLPKANTTAATQTATPPSSSSEAQSTTSEEVASALSGEKKDGRKPYTKFAIASPADQESIQNQPILNVSLEVEPTLQAGDVIQVYVDGGPIGNASHATEFNLTVPYRGTHVLSAILFDKDMHVLAKTSSITIYVHQAHLGSPAS
jgi:hypothetical protein